MRALIFIIVISFIVTGCSKPTAEDMFNKGVDAQKDQNYDAAIEAYQELIQTYPDSARAPEAMYAIGLIYQNRKQDVHEAIRSFQNLVTKYPHHATASSACFMIAFIYNNDLKNYDSAKIAYEYFLKNYPESPLIASAQFELSNLGKEAGEILQAQTQNSKEVPKQEPGKKKK